MKIPAITVLNSIGFTNNHQRILYAVSILQAAILPLAKVVVAPKAGNVAAIEAPASSGATNAKDWIGAITISRISPIAIDVHIELPYELSPQLIGRPTNQIGGIKAICPDVTIARYDGTKASTVAETKGQADEPEKLEQYLYKYAMAVGATFANSFRVINGIAIPVKVCNIAIPANNLNMQLEDLQLHLIGTNSNLPV